MEIDSIGHNVYKEVLDNLYEGVYLLDEDRKIVYWNKGAERITGYIAEEVIGKHCGDNILNHIDEKGNTLCKGLCPSKQAMTENQDIECELYVHHKEGYRLPISTRVTPLKSSDDKITGAVEIFTDNSLYIAMRQKVEELQKMAMLDTLMEIGNRRYAEINLKLRLSEIKKYKLQFGVLFIDIDHFKNINDSYGHDIGDRVLKMVAKTLSNNLRAFDVVCRWGGEELISIITNVNENQLYYVADKLRVLVEKSIITTGSDIIYVTISIGATIARPEDTIDTLIKRADKLMYKSKISGRNRVTMEPT